MKRLVTVLALLMLVFAFLGGQAFTADIYDPGLGDDHPWEEWEESNGQGNCNQGGAGTSYTAVCCFPVEILTNKELFARELKRLLFSPDKSTLSGSEERDLYIDRTKQASFK